MAQLEEAELLLRKDDGKALDLFARFIDDPEIGAFSCFRMGEIYNRLSKPIDAYNYHTQAFIKNTQFTQILVKDSHPSYSYRYNPIEESYIEACPLCKNRGVPYSVYNATTSIDFIHGFNPVRLWMCCDDCQHLFAYSFPIDLSSQLENTSFQFNLDPKSHLLPICGKIMMQIARYASGEKLLEVGVGAGEMSAVAKEFLFDITGLDIRPAYADAVSKLLCIPVHTVDFQYYDTDERYDVILMGDVIEHMLDPVSAVRKARKLLNDNGILWISTPNYESSFSLLKKDADPMWRIVEHLNYFSFRSLRKLLAREGFEILEYNISAHYNGSMELITIKK